MINLIIKYLYKTFWNCKDKIISTIVEILFNTGRFRMCFGFRSRFWLFRFLDLLGLLGFRRFLWSLGFWRLKRFLKFCFYGTVAGDDQSTRRVTYHDQCSKYKNKFLHTFDVLCKTRWLFSARSIICK